MLGVHVPGICCIGHIPSWKLIFGGYFVPITGQQNRDNDQNHFFVLVHMENKMAAISSGARAATFDWNDLDRKRKLFVI